MYFSNALMIFSNLPSSYSTVLLAVVTLLTTTVSISYILALWSFSSVSIACCRPYTADYMPSTISLSFLFCSDSKVYWWLRDIKFCSLVPLMMSFIVTNPSWTWPIIRFSLSKDIFSSLFSWSNIEMNFVSTNFLKSSSFLILKSVSTDNFFSKVYRSCLSFEWSFWYLSFFIFSTLCFSSSV